MKAPAPHKRIKEARERAGLSIDEVAVRSGIGRASVFDLEEFEGDLTSCYSPTEVKQLCQSVGIQPVELFGDGVSEPAVSAEELVKLIDAECKSRGITLGQFEDVVGWTLHGCMEKPELLLQAISIDGLQWLCSELKIDWRRVLLGLEE